MAPKDENGAQTSLQRLLQLNQADKNLEDCLHEAAQTLCLHKNWDDFSSPLSDVTPDRQSSHKRPEWVLRWLLEKFNTSPPACASVRAWILFWRLLPLIPTSSIARNLSALDFLGSVEKVLLETTTSAEQETALSANPKSASSEEDTPSHSRKRKRGSDDPSARPEVHKIATENGPRRIIPRLVVLDRTLKHLIKLASSDSSEDDSTERQHLIAVFHTTFDRAVRILHHWQLSLLELGDTLAEEYGITLFPAMYILDSAQASSSSEPTAPSMQFAEECLMSSMRFLDDHPTPAGGEDGAKSTRSITSKQIEQLLAKHILLPARAQYFAEKHETNVKQGQSLTDGPFAALQHPHSQIITDASSHGRYSPELRATLNTIPRLWRLGLQITPRSTPKRQSTEEPWLRALFVALAECAGAAVTGEWSIAVHPHYAAILGEMLDICHEYSVSLGLALLESIVRRYSGMCLSEEESISWSLVAKVIRLNANVFLPGTPAAEMGFVDDSGPLHELVVRHISSMPWKDDYDLFNAARKILDASKLQSSETAFTELNSMSPDEFRSSIPIALMHAYAQSRNLSGFLDVWHTELIKSTRHIVLGNGHSTVWEDQRLAKALRPLLESSLTDSQVRNEATKFAHPFAELEEAQNILYVFTELRKDATGTGAAANIVMLDAITAAIKSDSIVELCRDTFLPLYKTLFRIGSKPAINKHIIMSRIWRIISRIERLTDPLIAQDVRQSLSSEAVEIGCFEAAIDAIRSACKSLTSSSYARGREGFAFALRSCAPLLTSDVRGGLPDIVKENIHRLAQELETIFTDEKPTDSSTTAAPFIRYKLDVACILLEDGSILNLISSDHRQSLFRGILRLLMSKEGTGEHALLAQPSSPDDIVDALFNVVMTSGTSHTREDYFSAFLRVITEETDDTGTSASNNVAYNHLCTIPPRVFPRTFVEDLIDHLLESLPKFKQHAHPDDSVFERDLALLVKVLELPYALTKSKITFELLSGLSEMLNEALQPSLRLLFEQVVQSILANSPADSELRRQIIRSALDLEDLETLNEAHILLGRLSMVLATIPFLPIEEIGDSSYRGLLEKCLNARFQAEGLKPVEMVDQQITVLLDIMVAILKLTQRPYDFATAGGVDLVENLTDRYPQLNSDGRRAVLTFFYYAHPDGLAVGVRETAALSTDGISPRDQQRILADLSIRLSFKKSDSDLLPISQKCLDQDAVASLPVFSELLKQIPRPITSDAMVDGDIFVRLGVAMVRNDTRYFDTTSQSIKTILSEKASPPQAFLVGMYI
ncbi:hypothetical protein NA57DRAFT_51258 [Rhizodiscina lignyota]|uniref:Nucleolar 27S pre-rRNA processing Urb2/Npa2 C-terminal domain-containing protein n=1 Tax=Rhizodiscina lignyota TaxID=1504668 RepID=A0A9P4IMU7_9PEZI|nr:hypothetical protein NA57DRAFT_51258 [Rhizodiscina lignyota]